MVYRLIAAALLMCADASHATDYVKCEAIQKALERAEQGRSEVISPLVQKFYSPLTEAECGKRPNINDFDNYSAYSAKEKAFNDCVSSPAVTAKMTLMVEAEPAVSEWNKKIKKIQSDSKKEGCP